MPKEPRGEIKMDKKTLFEAGYTTLAGKSNEEETAVGGERLARIAMENLAADLARKIHSLVEMARAGQGTSPWLDDDSLTERVKELRGKFYKLAAEAEDLLRDVLGVL